MKPILMVQPTPPADLAIDPVCRMTVDPTTAAGRHDYQDKTYYFCVVSCLEKFKADPEQFLKAVPVGLIAPGKKKSLPMMMSAQPAPAIDEIDPVCGMTVQPTTAAGLYEYGGKTYYFCATRGLEKFRADPDYYLTPPDQLTRGHLKKRNFTFAKG